MTNYTSHSAKILIAIRDNESNPFATLEALYEHLGSLRYQFRLLGVGMPLPKDVKPNTPEYHLVAAEEAAKRALDAFSALLPEIYDASEGDDQALASQYQHLTELANKDERKYRMLMSK